MRGTEYHAPQSRVDLERGDHAAPRIQAAPS